MPHVGREQAQRQQQKHSALERADLVLAENLQQPRQDRHTRTEQNQPDEVERTRSVAVVVGHVALDDHERGDTHRHVNEKDLAPGHPMHD